jgi:hypothetical protein
MRTAIRSVLNISVSRVTSCVEVPRESYTFETSVHVRFPKEKIPACQDASRESYLYDLKYRRGRYWTK